MRHPFERTSPRRLWILLAAWLSLVAGSWLLPRLAGLEESSGRLLFFVVQAAAAGVGLAAALVAGRRRMDLSRWVFGLALLPLLWALGLAGRLALLLYLAS